MIDSARLSFNLPHDACHVTNNSACTAAPVRDTPPKHQTAKHAKTSNCQTCRPEGAQLPDLSASILHPTDARVPQVSQLQTRVSHVTCSNKSVTCHMQRKQASRMQVPVCAQQRVTFIVWSKPHVMMRSACVGWYLLLHEVT